MFSPRRSWFFVCASIEEEKTLVVVVVTQNMSARPSRRHASKTDQAKQRLEQLKRLKEDGKKRLDDIDGDEDVANVYDEVRSPFASSSSKVLSDRYFFPKSFEKFKKCVHFATASFPLRVFVFSVFFDYFKTTTLTTTKKNKNKNDAKY